MGRLSDAHVTLYLWSPLLLRTVAKSRAQVWPESEERERDAVGLNRQVASPAWENVLALTHALSLTGYTLTINKVPATLLIYLSCAEGSAPMDAMPLFVFAAPGGIIAHTPERKKTHCKYWNWMLCVCCCCCGAVIMLSPVDTPVLCVYWIEVNFISLGTTSSSINKRSWIFIRQALDFFYGQQNSSCCRGFNKWRLQIYDAASDKRGEPAVTTITDLNKKSIYILAALTKSTSLPTGVSCPVLIEMKI